MPSSFETLRTNILNKAKRRVKEELETIKATWPQSGVSIVSDGWIDPTRHPLINFIVSSPNDPVFIKCVNAVGKYKDRAYLGTFDYLN